MHLWVTRLVFVPGGGGGSNQGRAYGRAGLQGQAALGQQFIDGAQDLLGELVLLQPMFEAQDGGFVRQTAEFFQLGKLAIQRGIEFIFLNSWFDLPVPATALQPPTELHRTLNALLHTAAHGGLLFRELWGCQLMQL